MMGAVELVAETPYRWRIERRGAMRVPGIVFALDELLPAAAEDRSLVQVANVATLPGIVEASYAMPDVHWGYGFPIGGVAATDVDAGAPDEEARFPAPRREDEFVCSSCFLLKPRTQLGNLEQRVCRDCLDPFNTEHRA